MMVRFSSRLLWGSDDEASQVPSPGRRSEKTLDLTNSNPTRAGFSYPREGILRALSIPGVLEYHPDAPGSETVRQAISLYYGGAVSPEHIVATASTSEAYSLLFKLLCDAGNSVLVPRPSYPLFGCLAGLESVEIVPYDMRYCDGWFLDIDYLHATVRDNTRALIFVNPGNPTGSFLRESEYGFLSEMCRERGMALICDEVFADYALSDLSSTFARSIAGRNDALTFVLSGLSKVSGLPQMKLGWIVASGPAADRDRSLCYLHTIADTYLSVAGPVQHAGPELLNLRADIQPQILARIRRNYAALHQACRGTALETLQTQGGWSAILRLPAVRTDEQWVHHLLEHYDVLTHPGFYYDIAQEGCLVISLLTVPEILDEGLRRTILACEG